MESAQSPVGPSDQMPYPLNQIVMVPIDDLCDPPWDPRPVVDEGPLQLLVDYIAGEGYTPPILAWVGDGRKPWPVLSGKRRRLANQRLGKTEIATIFLDCSEERAKDLTQSTNEDDKPYWLGSCIQTETRLAEFGENYEILGKRIGKTKSWVSRAISLTKLLSNTSRKMIFDQYLNAVANRNSVPKKEENQETISVKKGRKAQKEENLDDKQWFLLESVALELLPLFRGRPVIEAVRLADQVVPVVLSQELDAKGVAKLVGMLNKGHEISDFMELNLKGPAKSQSGGATAKVHHAEGADPGNGSAHPKSDPRLEASGQGADPGKGSAHPKSDPRLEASGQGADPPIESAHPKSMAQIEAEPQGAGPEVIVEEVKKPTLTFFQRLKLFWQGILQAFRNLRQPPPGETSPAKSDPTNHGSGTGDPPNGTQPGPTAQGADSSIESALPKSGPQHVAAAQGADSSIESALPKSGPQHVAAAQGADSSIESALPKSGPQHVATAQGADSSIESALPKSGPQHVATAQGVRPRASLKANSQPPKTVFSDFLADLAEVFQGFTAAGVKDFLGKIPENKWQAVGYILEKGLKGGIKCLGHLLVVLVKHFFKLTGKGIHNISKSVAAWVMPIHSSSGSRSHGTRTGQNPLLYLGHWVVYGFITLACYSIVLGSIANFIPVIGPWIRSGEWTFLHLLPQVPLWLLGKILQHLWISLGLWLMLLWMIHRAFKPGLGWLITLFVLFLAAWHFKGWVMDQLHLDLPAFEPKTSAAAQVSGPKSQTEGVGSSLEPTHPNRGPNLEDSAQGHDLRIPITEKGMGTPPPLSALSAPPPTAIVSSPPPSAKPKPAAKLKTPPKKVLVESQSATLKTENSVAPVALPGAPATGEEAAWVAELIPAFHTPFLVKPLDLQPDPTISPVMVQKRLSEIQDPERFRVYVGHDRQTIKSMNVDDGGMDLFFNGSFGGLLGDSSSFRFFWEDVQGIRLATVEVSGDKPQTLCFCALEVKTKKKMAAFECAPGDVAHLVSALAAQFKSSTKREVSVAPLPYLNQGMWLGGQNQVDGMWKESPAGRSQEVKLRFTPADWKRPTTGGGIRLGDYLWSLGVNQDNQTGKEELLRQLGGTASGPSTLFVVGPDDWRKAQNAETGPENDPFNPPRRAVRLPAP